MSYERGEYVDNFIKEVDTCSRRDYERVSPRDSIWCDYRGLDLDKLGEVSGLSLRFVVYNILSMCIG